MYLTILDYLNNKVSIFSTTTEEVEYYGDIDKFLEYKYPNYKEDHCNYLLTPYLDVNIKL